MAAASATWTTLLRAFATGCNPASECGPRGMRRNMKPFTRERPLPSLMIRNWSKSTLKKSLGRENRGTQLSYPANESCGVPRLHSSAEFLLKVVGATAAVAIIEHSGHDDLIPRDLILAQLADCRVLVN